MDITVVGLSPKSDVDLRRWAEITIEKWQFVIMKKRLMHTGDLLNSFQSHVTMDADGNSALISFAFQYYLRMLEMGVGKGVSFGDVKSNTQNRREDGRQKGNRRKQIRGLYNGVFFGEAMRLLELMQAAYAKEGAKIITDEFMLGSGKPTV